MNQQGIAPVLLLLCVVILGFVIAGAFYLSQQSAINTPAGNSKTIKLENTPTATPVPIPTKLPSTTPISSITITKDQQPTEEFPFYPGSKLIKKETDNKTCVRDKDGNSICNLTILNYETPDDYDKVSDWFLSVEKQTKWNCDGGMGEYNSPRDASNERQCEKGTLKYLLGIQAKDNSTEIIVNIPNI